MVAKSYQKRTLVGEPYVGEKGKMYQRRDIVEGSSPNGSQKVVTKYFLKILPKNRKVLEIQDFCVRVQF